MFYSDLYLTFYDYLNRIPERLVRFKASLSGQKIKDYGMKRRFGVPSPLRMDFPVKYKSAHQPLNSYIYS